ncbi:MAG TPA: NAD(P)-dependent glycerol-3-phosphate dehydrogenase [Phycisphaerales bacterium]|nr:NAD(P)-dependent glycerol-3-phosphate dehydrogenase [Phycisphaerales bacterium]
MTDQHPTSIAVLGVGQMGLVCANMLAGTDPGHDNQRKAVDVRIWGRNTDEIGALAQMRRSKRLDGFQLDETVRPCLDVGEALEGVELVVVAIPAQHIREVIDEIHPLVPRRAGFVSVAKGIEVTTLLRPTQVIAEALKDDPDAAARPLGCLSGPTIATELAKCLPATMVAASDPTTDDGSFAEALQRLFNTSWMRIYTNTDLLGVELAGATKNVIAIAAGILDGLQAGYNAKSALLVRGLAEIARLGIAMGASRETFFGIAGVGDLATTCFSPEGRNRSCGEALGQGASLADYLKQTPFVVEGVETTKAVLALSAKYRVEMPIAQAVHAVLFDGQDPLDAITRLMNRQLKAEQL